MAESDWSACPREILHQCFVTQTDYYDNKAAGLSCKACHYEMRVALAHRLTWPKVIKYDPEPLLLILSQQAFKGLAASGLVLSGS